MTRCTCRLACNAFHSTAITKESKGVIIDDFKTRLVEVSSCGRLCDGQSNSIGEALTKRASGNLNAWSILGFGMSGSDTINALLEVKVSATDLG